MLKNVTQQIKLQHRFRTRKDKYNQSLVNKKHQTWIMQK